MMDQYHEFLSVKVACFCYVGSTGNLELYVDQDNLGEEEPCFYVRDKRSTKTLAKFFILKPVWHGKLTTKNVASILNLLRKKLPQKVIPTYWELIITYWNNGYNSKTVGFETNIPDYSLLPS